MPTHPDGRGASTGADSEGEEGHEEEPEDTMDEGARHRRGEIQADLAPQR